MTIIYATGRPQFFKFGTSSSQRQLPVGAMILAVIDGEVITNHLNEGTFERMTDGEYYELQGLISKTRQDERGQAGRARKARWRDRFWAMVWFARESKLY